MVSETVIETPEVEPVAEPEVAATEPEVSEEPIEVSPEPQEVEEAPPAEIAPVQVEPPRTYTAEEVQQHAAWLAQQQMESNARRMQSERDKAIARQNRDIRDRQELQDVVSVAIARGDDENAINNLIIRHTEKRREQIVSGEQSHVAEAAQWLMASVAGQQTPPLTPDIEPYAAQIGPWLQYAVDQTQQQTIAQLQAAGWRGPDEYAALVKAGVEAELKKGRAGNQPLNRPEGSAPQGIMSVAAFEALSLEKQDEIPSAQRARIYQQGRK